MFGSEIRFTSGRKHIEQRLMDEVKAIESNILDNRHTFEEINELKTRRAVLLEVINLPKTIEEELDAKGQSKG